MTNSTKSKHTTIYFVSGATAATKIQGVRSFSTPETSVSRIDTSSFDDDFNQYVSGRKDVGEISFEVIYDATDHTAVMTLVNSGAETEFMVIAPASDTVAATAPTVASSAFASYTAADAFKFRGYFSKFQCDVQDNNVWMGRISIQGTGAVTAITA
jgi:hypothetical protein